MSEYYYHGTTVERLPSIAALGLTPATEHPGGLSYPNFTNSSYLYFTRDYPDAVAWAAESSDVAWPLLLRFKKSALNGNIECDPNFFETDINRCDNLRTKAIVPPASIEVASVVLDTDSPYLRKRYKLGEWFPIKNLNLRDARAFTMIEPAVFSSEYTYLPMGTVYGFEPAIKRAQKLFQRVRAGEFD